MPSVMVRSRGPLRRILDAGWSADGWGRWGRVVLMELLLCGMAWLSLAGTHLESVAADEPVQPMDQEVARVELTIDYGDGVEKRFQGLTFEPGLTVLGVMEKASKHPRGIKFEYRGQGETAFLKSIDGLANEGRGRNWIFRVNDRLGESSFAVHSLKAGDKVSWRFGKYDGK